MIPSTFLRPALAASALALAACIPIVSGSTTPSPAELAGSTPIRLVNVTQRPICYVRLAPAGSADFGGDWLGQSETVAVGNYRDFGVRPGSYNFRVESCDGGVIQQQLGVDMTAAREIVIFEGAAPTVPETVGLVRLQYAAFPRMAPPSAGYAYADSPSEGSSSSEPGGGGGYDTAGQQRDSAPAAPSGPATYSLSLHNDCDHTVGLFHGNGRPPFGSGTYGTLSANSTESFSGFVGSETFWITDDSRNGVSAYTPSAGSQSIEVTSGCGGFAPR